MSILESLKFVKSAYSKDDLVPNQSCFSIRDRRVTAYNGTIATSAPIAIDLEIAPQANHFYKCITACNDEVKITLEKSGKVRVNSGKFKSLIPCIDKTEAVRITPNGITYEIETPILESIAKILPFIDEKSNRDFAQSLLIKNGSLFATNNKTLIEIWNGLAIHEVAIPKRILIELVRNKEEPVSIVCSHNMIFFMLPDSKWMASKLSCLSFPDLRPILATTGDQCAFPATFWEDLKQINNFADEAGKCHFKDGAISTSERSDLEGCSVECSGIVEGGVYNSKEIMKLEHVADKIDFSLYPAPVPFSGYMVRGVTAGYRTR